MYSYCYKFHLYAQHSVSIQGHAMESHPHTWSFIMYLEPNEALFRFHDVEEIVCRVLRPYENCYLNEMAPFDALNPTLENIGEVFYVKIVEALRVHQINVKHLEISESPVRTYLVDQGVVSAKNSEMQLSGFLQGILQYTEDTLTEEVQVPENGNDVSHHHLEIECNDPVIADEEAAARSALNVRPKKEKIKEPFTKWHATMRTIPQGISMILAILTVVGSAALLLWYVNLRGNYPWGWDTCGHIFKADLLYQSMESGDFFPNYTELWYNGIQPFRYWAPIPYYILALFQFLANGDGIAAYNVFIAFSFLIGAFGWLLWGLREKRIFLSLILGILWFCMPDNIRVFFSEGNLPRVFITTLLPYLFFFLWQFIAYKKKNAMIGVILFTALLCLSHLMITAMVGITVFIFLFYYGIVNKTLRRPFQALVGMLLGICLCGFWVYPALQGGLISMDNEAVSEVMKELTYPFIQSLNPMLRFDDIETFYFGLSFVAISVAGLFLSNRKSVPGFLTLMTVFLGTTTAFVPILLTLPLNQLLWMKRFAPMAYALFVIGILMWKTLRKRATVLLVLLLVLDSFVSFHLLAFNSNPAAALKELLDDAKEITNQRVAILDSSEFGSFPSYYLTMEPHPVSYAYGWAWQGAQTAQNIMLLNTALEKEYYIFMFDRCLEAGCDTVIVKKDKVKDFDKLNAAAQKSRYNLIGEYQDAYLYHCSTPVSFGLKTEFGGLAIGKSAPNIVLEFAAMELGNSHYLDDYTLEYLMRFPIIYLSDFEYRDQKKAEKLVLDAAEQGVHFVIDMNRVPYEAITNRMTFLGVTAQSIQFENQLPSLHFRGMTYFPIAFQEENRTWNTVYLENVPNPRGFSWFGGNKLVFIGEHTNPNITFIGFNLLYHGIVNKDAGAIDLFGTVIGMLRDSVPYREMVPIELKFEKDHIYVHTGGGEINTTLANLDAFQSNGETYSKHNLLHVTQTETDIEIQYAYWKEGLVVSLIGLLGTVVFLYLMYQRKGEKCETGEKSNISTSDPDGIDRISV